ncbi:hypothetical protein V1477_006818, partial [Vespula maculifrons]
MTLDVAVEVVKRPRPKPTVGNISITVEVNDFQEIDRELSHEDDDDDDDGGDPRCILATTNRQNILMVLGYDLEASTPTKGLHYLLPEIAAFLLSLLNFPKVHHARNDLKINQNRNDLFPALLATTS